MQIKKTSLFQISHHLRGLKWTLKEKIKFNRSVLGNLIFSASS